MYEEHTRFMIMAEHELSEETTAAADQEAFNSHLNLEQINKVSILLTLQLEACCYGCAVMRPQSQLSVLFWHRLTSWDACLQALISLNAMYDKQRTLGQGMPCEAEFRAYHLLTLIGTHGRYRYDATEYQGALAVNSSSCPRPGCLLYRMHLNAVRMQSLYKGECSQGCIEAWAMEAAACGIVHRACSAASCSAQPGFCGRRAGQI